ncbi:MAG: MarR family winged helix-turn-helix transcriptional regulator [Armatimonadota bacterium]
MVMHTAPLLMRTIRGEMRRQRPAELSLPQFRTLSILQRHPEISLSQLAARLEITLASASKLIDLLAKHGLVSRESSLTDRRKIVLQLSDHGRSTLDTAWQAAHARLAEMLETLDADDQVAVARAMHVLHAVLENDGGGA